MTDQLRIRQETEPAGEPDAPEWHCRFSLDGDRDTLARVESVIYTLDRSFEDPVRRIDDPHDGFAFDLTCWGEFELHANVLLAGGESQFLAHEVTLPAERPDEPAAGGIPLFEPPRLAIHVADAVLDGGGLRAAAFAGALEGAAEAGFERWSNVAGSAAGAVVAALLSVGYRPRDISSMILTTDFRTLFRPNALWMLRSFPLGSLGGTIRTQPFRDWLGERFAVSPLGKSDPTFGDVRTETQELSPRGRYRLRILASDITRARMLVLPDDLAEYEDESGAPLDPDAFPLVDAVLMSISIPILFPPYRLRRHGVEHYIVDGSTLSNFPVWLFDSPFPTRPTWGVRIVSGDDDAEQPPRWRRPSNLFGLLRTLLWAIQTAAREIEPARNSGRTITITAPGQNNARAPSLRELDAQHAAGLRAARDFFATRGEYENSLRRGLPDDALGAPLA